MQQFYYVGYFFQNWQGKFEKLEIFLIQNSSRRFMYIKDTAKKTPVKNYTKIYG